MTPEIRKLRAGDARKIADSFARIGWNKPVEQYNVYLLEQECGQRDVLVAWVDGRIAGYLTIKWEPEYAPFRDEGIPEIQDLNVLPDHRRKGIASSLMDRAEEMVRERSELIGIGVGMYPDYGNAQRMYVLRGYIPDGRGLTYRHQVLEPMASAINDDDLVLYFTRQLR